MQHVTFADKSLLLGDTAARILLEYAAALARHTQADTVELNAISSDGDEVVAIFLLNSGSPLMVESATTSAPEPENSKGVDYMLDKITLLENVQSIVPVAYDADTTSVAYGDGTDFDTIPAVGEQQGV